MRMNGLDLDRQWLFLHALALHLVRTIRNDSHVQLLRLFRHIAEDIRGALTPWQLEPQRYAHEFCDCSI